MTNISQTDLSRKSRRAMRSVRFFRPEVGGLEDRRLLAASPTLTAIKTTTAITTYGQSIAFTASVSNLTGGGATPTGGTVTFSDESGTIGSAALSNGVATFATSSLGTGVHTVNASYDGTSSYAASVTGTIVTVAGNGVAGYSGDNGPALSASMASNQGMAFDTAGNLYIADYGNHAVREVLKSSSTMITVAGNGKAGYSGDNGPATSATLRFPRDLVFDVAGDLYIGDDVNNVVRKVSKSTGKIATVAGNGIAAYSGDNGLAINASLNNIRAVIFDTEGNLYISDFGNNVIRKIEQKTGLITTIAGTGIAGTTGDNGPATSARINRPNGIAFDSFGNLYIAEEWGNVIRKVVKSSGTIITVAGTGPAGFSGDNGLATTAKLNGPEGIWIDSADNLFIADMLNMSIREVTKANGNIITVAGTGLAANTGDFGPANIAALNHPYRIALDSLGYLYSPSMPSRVRKFSTASIIKVEAISTSTSLTSSSPTSIYGQSVTFTARVTSGSGQPTGTVNFYDGTNLISSIAVTSSGDAIFSSSSLSLGAHTITAKYQGDVNFGSSNSSNLVQTVKIGSPAFLSLINGDAQSTTVATVFGNLLQVFVTDAYSNPISNSPVTFSINSNKASGSFASSSTVNTNVNGYALAPKLTANTVAGTFTVTASVTGLQNVVFNLTNLPGAASKVVTVSGANQSTTVNTAFAAPLVAKVTDTYSNPISGVQVTFNAPGDGAFALFSGPTTVTSNSDGFVTSPSLVANTVSGSYNVIASAQNLTSAQFLLTNKSGQASTIAKQSGNNQATTVNTSFANPISVEVSDSFGNPVSGVNVVFSGPTTGAGIFFTGTSTVTTNAQGIATPTGIKANTIVGIYNVQAYVNDQLNTTFNLTNLAGAASKLVLMGGNNQSAVVNTAYAAPIQLLVTDSFGNAVSNSPITFTAPSSGGGIIVTGSNQAVSNTDGMASWSAFIANKIAGSFNVTASLSGGASYSLNLTNNPGAVASLVPVCGNNQSSVINGSFPTALQVKVLDAFGNAVANVPVAFTTPTTGATVSFVGGSNANSDNSGIATSSPMVANGLIGKYTVTASASGAPSVAFALSNTSPTLQSIVVQQGNKGRSYVRYVDININDPATVTSIVNSLNTSAPRITMTNTGLTGTTKKAVTIKGLAKAIGNTIRIDFGTKGIGGNAETNTADGSYLISLDVDGNGSLETSQRFFRLLGDVNGDKVVDSKDTALVTANLNKGGMNQPGDTNGDGKVNATDVSYVKKAQKRRITV